MGTKILVDIANPLDFSKGFPPTLSISNNDSLGELVQRTYPALRVVKTLNTMSADIMIAPDRLPGEHVVFVSGNDAGAKASVGELLMTFGWKSIIDLGDITTARGTESFLPLWVRMWKVLGTGDFNIQIVKANA
ncbi:MAG: hypothetical protein H0U74_19365 [Bradymonadaceae bacterium]|nr:hypothetical protein [Lujinxingiaceae bacterium]